MTAVLVALLAALGAAVLVACVVTVGVVLILDKTISTDEGLGLFFPAMVIGGLSAAVAAVATFMAAL